MSAQPCSNTAAHSQLYLATVRHVRTQTLPRAFAHRVYLWLVDLDALPALPRWLRPFAAFHARDHLGDPTRTIRQNIDTWPPRA